MDKLLHDSLTVHLENFGYKNIPKLENIIPKLKDYNETINSINYMLGVPRFKLGMSDEEFEDFRESQCGGFTKPFTKPEIKKENNKMITAEEARKITCKTNKIVNSLIDDMINPDIKTVAEDGEWVCFIYFNANSTLEKYLSNVEEILMDNGYGISVEELNAFDSYDYKLRISWKEVGI